MTEREQVIEALEICAAGTNSCNKCPMKDKCKGVSNAAMVAAIKLLKEQKVMHWNSVKDRLPTYAELKDDCVLVLLEDGTICSTGFDECIEDESIFGEWRKNVDPVTLGATDSYWMPLKNVTHWMPIPKLPWEGQ